MAKKEVPIYETWYDFKKELQRRSGITLSNERWLELKPKVPLPWPESKLKETLVRMSGTISQMRCCPRCGGDLLMEKDIETLYKICVQCGFNVEIMLKEQSHPKTVVCSDRGCPGSRSEVSSRRSDILSSEKPQKSFDVPIFIYYKHGKFYNFSY